MWWNEEGSGKGGRSRGGSWRGLGGRKDTSSERVGAEGGPVGEVWSHRGSGLHLRDSSPVAHASQPLFWNSVSRYRILVMKIERETCVEI